jgi:hypothetical protein
LATTDIRSIDTELTLRINQERFGNDDHVIEEGLREQFNADLARIQELQRTQEMIGNIPSPNLLAAAS